MRARYYEASTGTFLSEDPARHGWKWFSYYNNDPVSLVDKSGKELTSVLVAGAAVLLGLISIYMMGPPEFLRYPAGATVMISGLILISAWFFGGGSSQGSVGERTMDFAFRLLMFSSVTFVATLVIITRGFEVVPKTSIAKNAVAAVAAYSFTLLLFMGLDAFSSEVENYNGQ